MKYQKLCKCCGKPFETNNPQKLYCDRKHYLPCPVCGKPVLKTDKDFSRPPKCCSTECAHKLRKSHFKPKKCIICGDVFLPSTGVQVICNKQHYKSCEICGKEFPVDNNNYKSKTTCSDECLKESMKMHSLEKYGTEHPMQNREVKKRHRESMLKKYGVEHALQKKEFSDRQQLSAYNTNMQIHGVPYACLLPQCVEAQGHIISKFNRQVSGKLQNMGFEVSFEKRLDDMSFDICIESEKILIEIDPTYTHNAVGNHLGRPKDKYYHRDKSLKAQEHGYRCIHIFDWDDVDQVLSTLTNTDTIYARKCKLLNVYPNYGNEFLDKYHIQGSCKGQMLYLGLAYNGVLVQLMTFGASRYTKKYDVEILRLCTLPSVTVVGGASKLFKWVTSMYEMKSIISYCDLSKFNGGVYTHMGMTLARITPPAKVWSKGHAKITDNLLRQRGYDQLFGTDYGKGTSNEQLMLEHGWLPVYDCGQAVYEWKFGD